MKATGIVRRIDDLGRVVIPKEIRRTLRIREGDPLEIFTASDGEVIFKKYSPMGELSEFSGQYSDILSRTADLPVIITDRDHVISVSGLPKKDYLERHISKELEEILSSDKSATEKALNAFVWGARGQFFWDGNKRTSMTLANKILIAAGAGFLTITDRHMEQFNTLLVEYYNTGDSEALKDFLYKNTIQGIA